MRAGQAGACNSIIQELRSLVLASLGAGAMAAPAPAHERSAGRRSPLGITTRYASSSSGSEKAADARLKRWALLTVAGELLPDERVSWCYRRFAKRLAGAEAADVCYSPKHKSAHYGGLMVCGSVWHCPVCAAKITEKRRLELAQALENAKAQQLTPLMLTVTFRHNRGMPLAESLAVITSAWRKLRSGRAWQALAQRFGLGANVAALEVTFGRANGWHPHKHVIYFSSLALTDAERLALEAELVSRWLAMLESMGYDATKQHGMRVQLANDAVAQYVAKFGREPSKPVWNIEHEATKSGQKLGRSDGEHCSPWQLLELAADGEPWAVAAFKEYGAAMHGKRQLVWGKGSRQALGLTQEATDEELAEERLEDAVILASLTWPQYKQVLKRRARGQVLEAARAGSSGALWAYLASIEVYPSEQQLERAYMLESMTGSAKR